MFKPITYGEYVFPPWANGVGWVLAMFSILMIPGTMLVKLLKAEGSMSKVYPCSPIAKCSKEHHTHVRDK